MEASPTRFAYDNLSPSIYDKLHMRFLRISGGEGQSAIEGAVFALVRPRQRVLDAGCGTGSFARRILSFEPRLDLTLLDRSPRLLSASRDLSVRRVHGDMIALPFADDSYDLATAFWAVEATESPEKAISELVRVTRPDGHICLLFCARLGEEDALDRLIRFGITLRGTGRYIDPQRVGRSLADAGARRIIRLACHGPVAAILANGKDRE